MAPHALNGVRVLDFTRVLAGPSCTMLLADLGAEVIKVEAPARGDDTREWGPPWFDEADTRQSAYFLSVNRNKRSLTLNLKHPTAQALVRRLVSSCDVLVENFKVGQMASYGLSYTDLQALNPALVYCSITGYGQAGEYAERPGYDYVVQAMSGLMSITGAPDAEPQKVGVAISDVIAGLYAANAIQAALLHARATQEGQHIDIALLDTQLAALVNIASSALISGQTPQRMGNQHPNIVPYQTFTASDGDFVLAVGNDRQFRALCMLIEQPALADDPRFSTNPARVAHRAVLVAHLAAVFACRPRAAWVAALLAAGIPAGEIFSVSEALSDAHVRARGMVQTLETPQGSLPLVASPIKMSATPPQTRLAPPQLGEHTAELLHELLGIDAETLATYRADGVL